MTIILVFHVFFSDVLTETTDPKFSVCVAIRPSMTPNRWAMLVQKGNFFSAQ